MTCPIPKSIYIMLQYFIPSIIFIMPTIPIKIINYNFASTQRPKTVTLNLPHFEVPNIHTAIKTLSEEVNPDPQDRKTRTRIQSPWINWVHKTSGIITSAHRHESQHCFLLTYSYTTLQPRARAPRRKTKEEEIQLRKHTRQFAILRVMQAQQTLYYSSPLFFHRRPLYECIYIYMHTQPHTYIYVYIKIATSSGRGADGFSSYDAALYPARATHITESLY